MVVNSKSKTGYSQIDHILITPYGFFVIETKNYQGTIYGRKGKEAWLINGKFKMINPLKQNYGHIQALKNYVDSQYKECFFSIVSFTGRCTFKVDLDFRKIQSNELVIYDYELTEYINRKISVLKLLNSNPLLNKTKMKDVFNTFTSANIKDPLIRKKHIDALALDKRNDSNENKVYNCAECGRPVSEKVKLFCENNIKFKGKILCYDHQKNNIKKQNPK